MNSICFDTETTGLHPNGSDPDEILTISIIGRDGSVLLDERFRPTVKTEWPHASAVNGIYPEDVADLPTIETAIPRLREIFAGADEVIGYNVGFDLGFLSAVGVRPREDARITDTMKEFTWFMGRRYKLVDAADHIGYEWTGRAHGSLADALATLAVQRWLEQWLVAEYAFSVAKLDADLGTKGLEAAFTANVAKSIHAEGSAAVAEKRDIEQQKAMVTETKERYLAQIRSVYRKYRKEIRGMEGMEIVDIPKLKLPRPDSDIADDSEVKRLILACWRGADELRAEVSSTVMPKGKKNGGNAGSGGSQRAQQAPAQERPEPNKENGER